MSGINKVILIGNMGKNPETKTFENGSKKVGFTLATTEVYKDKDGTRKELTEWHNVVCWRALADFAEKYLAKGRKIYVEGKLHTRTWDDDKGKHYMTEVYANTITLLDKVENKPTEQKVESAAQEPYAETAVDDGPFPF
ncbi:MAG: single-stranded DNA-binding protein [Bacteroidales bacterium]|nr:single-stranded DNA-binding protein [Bacteroidales bacterium]